MLHGERAPPWAQVVRRVAAGEVGAEAGAQVLVQIIGRVCGVERRRQGRAPGIVEGGVEGRHAVEHGQARHRRAPQERLFLRQLPGQFNRGLLQPEPLLDGIFVRVILQPGGDGPAQPAHEAVLLLVVQVRRGEGPHVREQDRAGALHGAAPAGARPHCDRGIGDRLDNALAEMQRDAQALIVEGDLHRLHADIGRFHGSGSLLQLLVVDS